MIANDIGLGAVCKMSDMPRFTAVASWISKGERGDERYTDFAEMYARAKQASAEVAYSEMRDIERRVQLPRYIENPAYSELEAAEAKEKGEEYPVAPTIPNPDYVDPQTARVLIDSIKWRAAKLKPRQYGDSVEVKHSGTVQHDHTHRAEPPDWMKQEIEQAQPAPMIEVNPEPEKASTH